jgi:Ca2+-binding RTX toxin-like protein
MRRALYENTGIRLGWLLAWIVVSAWIAVSIANVAAAQPPVVCFGQDTNDNRSTDDPDFLTGSNGDDVVALGDGPDQYFAADGSDVLCGNLGDDLLVGEADPDLLSGGNGDDVMVGLGGPDVLLGGPGSDELIGNGAADVLRAGALDGVRDDIYDGEGSDQVFGGDEDVWHRCADDVTDDHTGFGGTIVADPDC